MRDLRRRVHDFLRRGNIEYNYARHAYELSSACRSRERSSPCELRGLDLGVRRRLRKFTALTVDGWQEKLRENDEES